MFVDSDIMSYHVKNEYPNVKKEKVRNTFLTLKIIILFITDCTHHAPQESHRGGIISNWQPSRHLMTSCDQRS